MPSKLFGDLGKKLAGTFFEDVEPPPESQDPQAPEESLPGPEVQALPQPVKKPVGDTVEMKAEVREHLDKEVPPAYAAFVRLMTSMEGAVPDLSQRTRAALGALSAQGTTPEMLLEAFEERIVEVDEYAEGFNQKLATERQSRLGDLERRRAEISSQIESAETEISRLREELSRLRSERDTADEGLSSETERLDLLERRMSAVLADICSDFESERASVATHTVKEGESA
jgi:predicted  nucleic acid-binding Zn-ribbon protein